MKHETMLKTPAQQYERALDSTWRDGDLPSLTTVDRLALRVGVRLILWGRRHAERPDRDAQQRWSAADRASEEARIVFARRVWAGPVRW